MKSLIIAAIAFIIGGAYYVITTNRARKLSVNSDYLTVGQLLFPEHKDELGKFYNSYATDKATFISEYAVLLQNYENFDLEKLAPIEVLYIFGDSKEQIWFTDWRGEENEMEIETFIEEYLGHKVNWTKSSTLRLDYPEEDQRDGEFIIELFKRIDEDLQQYHKRLIFFSLGWDAHVFTAVDSKSFTNITTKMPSQFEGANELK